MVQETIIQPPGELGRISFAGADVGPPAPRIIGRGDRLFIRSRCSVASTLVTIRGRLLQAPDVLSPFEYVHAPNSDRTAAFSVFELAPGYLMGLQVWVSTGTVRRGQCYVEVGLLRGRDVAANIVEPLLADYATIDGALGWPGGRIRGSLEEPGYLYHFTGTNPAAGVEITETVPTNAVWRFHSAYFTLVTSAVAGNRRVQFVYDDGATFFGGSIAGANQAASTTNYYLVGAHSIYAATGMTIQLIPTIADLRLPQGYRVRTSTVNFDAGDNWNTPHLYVEEWIQE